MTETIQIPGSARPAAPAQPPAAAQPAGIEADMDVLIKEGVIERTVEPFPGWKFTMHTLYNHERVAVSKMIPNPEAVSLAASDHVSKAPTLLYSITGIEHGDNKGTFRTPEEKEYLKGYLSRMTGVMIDMIYLEYMKMMNDLVTLIETGVKKN